MSEKIPQSSSEQMEPNLVQNVDLIGDNESQQQATKKLHQKSGKDNVTQQQATTKKCVENNLNQKSDKDEDKTNFSIEELPDSMFKLECHVPKAFFGGIIGFRSNTKRRLESETETEIILKHHRTPNSLIIKGKSRSNLLAARDKINEILISLRKRLLKTHFVGIDLHKSDIREKFIDFRTQVLEKSYPGIDERLFMSDNRLHLTLQTCVLLDEIERTEAVKILQNCSKYLKGITTPFDIKVTGLNIMNDNPSAVRVLYGVVDAPELQKFADLCLAPFIKSGFSFKDYNQDNVKLHMTVMNSRYRKNNRGNRQNTFDARELLKQFGSFNFGSAECSDVSLCVIRTGRESVFYKIIGTLNF
ncbi:activating signal cointegrator 1 complex subunit 1-like [Teleopsis dalmanni]|uniref:activating signal cointegrator 1 complex subunit 1-like n=1 Tax=Teleopsis dalmanni TaxID=139649 RepID=UPI0018CD6BF4|nr:activating signal cointegrator 1 complex subunit 1-like [Teleopsis dalmanni]